MKSFIQTALLCLLLVKLSNCQQKAILPYPEDDIYRPRCPINETISKKCLSSCEPTCQNRNPGSQTCSSFICPLCECKPNFIRDEVTGNCISEKDCPIITESPCPENSVVIDPCAAEECVNNYPYPVEYAQADVAQEAQLVKRPIQSDLKIYRPFCRCIPECQCLPDYVMYNQQCYLRKYKPFTRPPPFETIGPIYSIDPVEYLSQKVASESRQHHQRKHHNREKQHNGNKKRHHSEKLRNKKN